MLFALAAVPCPWHRFQTSLRDRLLADLAHTPNIPCLIRPSASSIARQETTICLVQADLELRFRIGIRLLN